MKRGRSVSTQRVYLSAVRCFLTWSAEHGHLPQDAGWIARIELPQRPRSLPPTPLSEEQVTLLIAAATCPRDKAILTLMYATGLRRSEVVALNIAMLDPTRRQLLIRGKGDKDRIVPVAPAALDAVQAYLSARPDRLRPHAPLFATHHPVHPERLTTAYLSQIFRRLPHPLLRPVNPHLLRHTFAVHLLRGGADVRHVQALLGHESPDTTNLYLGLVKRDLKQAYDRAIAQLTKPLANHSQAA